MNNPSRLSEPWAAGGSVPPSRAGSTALRILLGAHLRRLRESRGISRERAGAAIRATHSKISRLELGRTSAKQRDLADLLTLYGINDERERESIFELARRARTPDWWHRYSDILPGWFETYIGLEEVASAIRTYEVQFIPGLLQTPDYARAVILLRHTGASDEEIEHRVGLRVARQRLLTMDSAPRLWTVLDEAVLRRPLGGPDVMREQLRYLIEITALPNVIVQIVPFDAGGHAAAGGPFSILQFPQPDLPNVVYTEQINSALYLDKPKDVDDYLEIMNRLCIEARTADESRHMLTEILART
jgi:transcriptional regulator with XRE-family HTH domain